MQSKILIVSAALLVGTASYGRIARTLNVSDMEQSSDAIVKGEVLGVKNLGPADFSKLTLPAGLSEFSVKPLHPDLAVASVRVERRIKGDAASSNVDVYYFATSAGDFISFAPGEYVLVFLKRGGDKFYLLDTDNGKLPASKTVSAPKHAAENSHDSRASLVSEFESMADDSDPKVALHGVSGLAHLRRSESLPTLRRLSKSGDAGTRAAAISGRVSMGDETATTDLLSALNSGRLDAQMYLGAIDSLARGKDPKRTQIIMNLAEHKNSWVRKQAIHELHEMKNPETIPALVKLLDDSDTSTQYTGVVTLCNMAHPGGVGCPSGILFERDRNKFISEWKAWAKDH